MSTSMVTVTLTGSDGFTGDVTLAAKAVDSTGAVIPTWTVTLDKSTLNFAADGAQTAVATLKIPTLLVAGGAGTLQIDATSSLGVTHKMSTITVANQLTVPMKLANATTCAQIDTQYQDLTIATGTKIRWVNNDPAARITIHVNSNNTQIKHEPDPGMAPNGGAYEQTSTVAGSPTWYCHAPGTPSGVGSSGNPYKLTIQ